MSESATAPKQDPGDAKPDQTKVGKKPTFVPDPEIQARLQARGTKAAFQAVAPTKPEDDPLAKVITNLSETAAGIWGAHWYIEPAESGQFVRDLDPVLEKYGWQINIGPELTLILTTFGIFGPRVMKQLELMEQSTNGNESESQPGKPSRAVSGGDGAGQNHGDETGSDAFTAPEPDDQLGSGGGSPGSETSL